MRKIIICVAPVAGNPQAGIEKPFTAEEVAADVVAAAKAGASMVHLHVRDSAGRLTEDIGEFSRTLDLIRAESDIVIQGSTGGVSNLSLEERCVALNDPRVEVASLNMGSVNFSEGVYINTLPEIRYWAGRMRERDVRPELVIFDGGMINNVKLLAESGYLTPPFVYGLCLGVVGAAPADAKNLFFLQDLLPAGAIWGCIHAEMSSFSLLAAAIGMGARIVRVGFEDSPYYAPGRMESCNAKLVERMADLIRILGYEVASPEEAREILGITR